MKFQYLYSCEHHPRLHWEEEIGHMVHCFSCDPTGRTTVQVISRTEVTPEMQLKELYRELAGYEVVEGSTRGLLMLSSSGGRSRISMGLEGGSLRVWASTRTEKESYAWGCLWLDIPGIGKIDLLDAWKG